MAIGERIKAARRRAGISQRELAERAGVSAMAISKYERGLAVPRSGVLIQLARALDVKVEFLLRPQTIRLAPPEYRRRLALGKKHRQAVLEQVREWLERYVAVERLFAPDETPLFAIPDDWSRLVERPEDAELAAERLREAWALGQGPLDNLPELLEDKGVKVGLVDAPEDFDALTVWANDEIPVIVVKRGVPGDRQRFSLAHELGHLLLEPADTRSAERTVNRFAGAFLVPRCAVYRELGQKRHRLDFHELHLLKH
ncbi:helix-turn-helix domain-containing protein, partial [Deferrisoma palaeochoriense]